MTVALFESARAQRSVPQALQMRGLGVRSHRAAM
jgi:hypothetical protein